MCWADGAGWEVRCLAKASSSLKIPASPPFYKIIADNQGTKLVYNLVYSRTRVTGAVSKSDLDVIKGGEAAGRGR